MRRPRRKTLYVVAAFLSGAVVLLVGVATALAAWLGAFSSDPEVPNNGIGDAGQPLGDLGPHTVALERALEARDALAMRHVADPNSPPTAIPQLIRRYGGHPMRLVTYYGRGTLILPVSEFGVRCSAARTVYFDVDWVDVSGSWDADLSGLDLPVLRGQTSCRR